MQVGVIGTGSIASWFIQAARLVEDVEFVAVYSRAQATGDKFAHDNRIDKVYTDLEKMLKDNDVEAVYIASPNSLHFDHAKLALEHNKHVLIEKPFTGNFDRAKELVALAQSKSLFLFETICNIHMPHMDYIKNRIQELGQLRMIQCNYSQYSSRYDALLSGKTPNVFNPKMSGGALMDLNIYNLHFTMYLFGKPESIHYFANQHENGIDTSGILILDYGEFKATLTGAKDSASYNVGQIQGETGHITIPNGVNGLETVILTTDDTKKEVVEQDKPRLYYQVAVFKDMVDNNDFELRDFYLEHSLNVVEVATEALRQIGLEFEY